MRKSNIQQLTLAAMVAAVYFVLCYFGNIFQLTFGACIKWNFKRKRGIGFHSSADNLFICRGVDLISDQNYRCRGCRGGLDDQSDWKYNESVSDHGGIFPDSIFTYPDHVESGNTYDFHSTCCIGLYENWD